MSVILKGYRFIVSGAVINPDPDPDPPTDPTGPTGTKAIIHGDSITAGAGASSDSNAYYSVYGNRTGLFVRTMAQYSRTVQESVQPWNALNSLENVVFTPTSNQAQYNPVFPYDPDYKYILFRLGVNDCIQKPGTSTNVASFKQKYINCLNKFIDLGWPKNRLKLINIGSYLGSVTETQTAVTAYNLAIAEIGVALGINVFDLHAYERTLPGGVAQFYTDEVHPSDLGHSTHGNWLADQLP